MGKIERELKGVQNIKYDLNSKGKIEVSVIKPAKAFQISTYKNNYYKTDGAEVALDGNENTWMHTGFHTNPWWCADMGDIYHITRVEVINRKVSWPQTSVSSFNRARNLRVGVTNTMPVVGEDLDLDAYLLCGEKPGLMGKSANVSCPNEVFGQYVVVQFNTTDVMHISEVKIYGYK